MKTFFLTLNGVTIEVTKESAGEWVTWIAEHFEKPQMMIREVCHD